MMHLSYFDGAGAPASLPLRWTSGALVATASDAFEYSLTFCPGASSGP